ncbi:hypothetical protein [Arthrobacter cavernae]|uniref:hypothetical protein n=1 Tax=Arthrobacter cavernae TaxID=2817681 RepID=UPI001F6224AB|nr:hypothetical protein [Arthrobacter cavernae]
MVAVTEDREDVFIRVATVPKWKDAYSNRDPEPAFMVLQDEMVVDCDLAKAAPRWNGTAWIYPQSELIAADMQELIGHLIGAGDDYDGFKKAFARLSTAWPWPTLSLQAKGLPLGGKYLFCCHP